MERIDNFRDFGSYEVQNGLMIRKGIFYRSGSLADATEKDIHQLIGLGIRTVCDLRSNYERERAPDPQFGAKYYHIPIQVSRQDNSGTLIQIYKQLFGPARHLDYAEEFTDTYREYVSNFCDQYSQVFRLIADPDNLPILIHCTAGKDRTGFVVSLIQRLLGVPVETVFQDYLLSNEYLGRFREHMLRRLRIFSPFGLSAQRFLPLLDARREYLTAAFDEIVQRFGSLNTYFQNGLDFPETEQSQFKLLALEQQ